MATTDRAAGGTEILTFVLDGTRYCIDLDRVASVFEVTDGVSTVDEASDPWYAGELSLAGERIRVVDLRRIVTATERRLERPDDQQLVVFDDADQAGLLYGWLVDGVGTITTADPAALDRSGATTRFLRGRLEAERGPVIWLDESAINS